jgi:drug/metabolite transporter (DMT)-like permease
MKRDKSISWLILLILSAVWGSSFILMKRGLEAYSSGEVAALRTGMAFLFLSPLHLRNKTIDFKKYWKGLFLMGIFGNLIPAFLFTAAETRISSSLAGMLNALTPIFTVIVTFLWMKIRPSGVKVSGVIIGFLAALALILFDTGASTFENLSYGFLVLLATVCYAISINAIKKYLSDLPSVTATLWAFTLTGPTALVYLFAGTDFTTHVAAGGEALSALGYVAILAVVGTALSVILYNVLIKKAGVLFASSCTYLIPVVAVIWGLADGENVNLPQVLSIVTIILSVYLINRD